MSYCTCPLTLPEIKHTPAPRQHPTGTAGALAPSRSPNLKSNTRVWYRIPEIKQTTRHMAGRNHIVVGNCVPGRDMKCAEPAVACI
eukprot:2004030-Rhodomonas_salina.1